MDRSASPRVFWFSGICGLAFLAACRTSTRAQTGPLDDPFAAERHERARTSREWISLGMVIVDRQQDEGDVLDDALGFTIDSGYDLARTALRPAIEIGGTWSNHEADTLAGKTDLDLVRVSMGARITFERADLWCVPYVRGGMFYRFDFEDESGLDVPDQNGRGHYLGAGLELAIEPGLTFGPTYTWYQGAEDDIEEHFLGLAVRFRF